MAGPRPSEADLKTLDPEGKFRERLEADRAAIAQLSESGDLKQLGRVVHGLAGAAGTFGYAELGDIALDLDERSRAGEQVTALDIARLVAALEQALGKPEKSG